MAVVSNSSPEAVRVDPELGQGRRAVRTDGSTHAMSRWAPRFLGHLEPVSRVERTADPVKANVGRIGRAVMTRIDS